MIMFKRYGVIGIILIVLVELNFFFKIQPFANWYFPLVCKLKKNSLMSDRFSQFLGMVILSTLFWWIFEFLNISVNNWSYMGLEGHSALRNLFGSISFATVLPAFFETVELIRSFNIFERKMLHKTYRITKTFIYTMVGIGAACFVLPFVLPKYTFPLVWLSLFFLLDPINYLHKQPSVIQHLRDRKLVIPLSLLLAGMIMGFFWEFWNYWAIPKWTYDVPFVGFFKLFEMPLLGYLGYFPFAFELYAMYWFIRSLFIHKEHLLIR